MHTNFFSVVIIFMNSDRLDLLIQKSTRKHFPANRPYRIFNRCVHVIIHILLVLCFLVEKIQGRAHLVIPLVIMGLVSVAGGLAALRLPETLNTTLPTTIEEGEEFGKDFKLVDCFQCVPPSVKRWDLEKRSKWFRIYYLYSQQ